MEDSTVGVTKSSSRGEKLKEIRKAEGMTQKAFSEFTGVPFGTIRNYEAGQFEVGLKVIDSVLAIEQFQKYTLWLMTGKIAPETGQISPALSLDGSEKQEENPDSHQSAAK
ncbi:TPA: helix-turn-helix transcriptional regulator [Enterobacter kobei]|nr:helix-turn-helix transcriptional regulator [Enterobacter kobei]